MNTLGITAGALVCAAATSAFAQSPPQPAGSSVNPVTPAPSEAARGAREVVTAPTRAPSKALELGVEGGYTQGFGSITSDPRVGAGPGGAIGLSLDDRVDPHWSVGAGGQYQGYGASGAGASSTTLRGALAEIHGTYHLSPYSRLDPHLTLGAGYRLFVESPAGDTPATLTHGLDLGKLEIGVDVRPSESVAISPVIGADVNLFAWRTGGEAGIATPLNRTVSTFVFAGVKGRFDIGGTREREPAP
jgi:hypothetical protein